MHQLAHIRWMVKRDFQFRNFIIRSVMDSSKAVYSSSDVISAERFRCNFLDGRLNGMRSNLLCISSRGKQIVVRDEVHTGKEPIQDFNLFM